MKNNEKDTFEAIKIETEQSNNFFLKNDISDFYGKSLTTEPSRRLNDYDFNLLQEDAYKDVDDDLFKLEYKISKIEKDLKSFSLQIQAAQEIEDMELAKELIKQQDLLKNEYESLLVTYNNKCLSAKISGKFFNIFDSKLKNNIKNVFEQFSSFSESILAKMPKQFSSIIELRKSLTKLENLNKSVDELITLNIPYGESSNKYEQLSKYIIKANSIQAELSRYIK